MSDTTSSSIAAPDWDNVPFDVGCARCGHDLKGLTDPTCPACALQFDWADAVPIEELTCMTCEYHLFGLKEMRCPECGTDFTWREVLDEFYRRKKPLFEYCWRKTPVRSLFLTFRLATRPRVLWSTIEIHDPPRPGPLAVLVLLACLVFFVLAPLSDVLSAWNTQRRLPIYGSFGLAQFIPFVRLGLSQGFIYYFPLAVLVWAMAVLMALMIFRQSMRRCRVRTAHVVRVWAYALPLMLPIVPVFRYICRYGEGSIRPYWFPDPQPYAAGVFIAFVIWSLRQGYRRYLRMPHSLAVAVASQVVALLATATFVVWMSLK